MLRVIDVLGHVLYSKAPCSYVVLMTSQMANVGRSNVIMLRARPPQLLHAWKPLHRPSHHSAFCTAKCNKKLLSMYDQAT